MAPFEKPQTAIVIAIGAVALAIAAGGLALANSTSGASATLDTVEVTGTATVHARPDTLIVDLTVQVIRSSSSAALSRDNAEMSSLQSVFRRGGVPAKDLATSNLNVGKNYNSNGKPAGYVASDSLTVTLTDLAKAGALLTAAQSVGNDVSIDNVSYSLVNVDGVLNSARADAVGNARAAAATLAKAAGSAVTGVTKITDQSTLTPPPITFNGAVAQKHATGSAPSIPLRPGTQSVTATVDVVFSLSN